MKHRAGSSVGSKGGKGQKGKGKGAAGASNSGSGGAVDLKDVPLQLVDYGGAQGHPHSKEEEEEKVPRFKAVLRRSDSDGVTLEDLDPLQLELEALLSLVVLRKHSLKEELNVVTHLDKYKKASLKRGNAPASSSPGKRGASSSSSSSSSQSRNPGESAKRFKASGAAGKVLMPSSSAPDASGVKVLGLNKVKSGDSVPSFDPLQNEQIRPLSPSPAKPQAPKNETPNRFWSFVEPYCAPISPEDIKLLEDLVRTHNDLSEYFRVPPLGQHYTQRWAKEDLENERQKSAAASADNSGSDESSSSSAKLLKKAASSEGEKSPFGEMTQRLVAGLIEENIMTSVEDSIDAGKKGAGAEDSEGKSQLIKSLNITNSEALEARVRKELEEQGILDPNEDADAPDEAGENDNDEILEELKRCQTELRAVSTHNLQQLKRLLKAAKDELVRQELRNKLAAADTEVMEAYQRVSNARSKKKPPTKKEREMAWKALKEREIILKELENV